MSTEADIEALNDLLAEESRSLLPRLRESTIFVSWVSTDEKRIVDCMIDDETQQQARLVDAIHRLGGDPWPVWGDIQSANIHFLELHTVLPRVLKNQQELLAAYENAAARIGGHPVAADVVSQNADNVRRHIRQIRELIDRAKAVAS